jgi:hypothetical protein
MVVTSALIRQTALRQLAHLAVGPRASTLVVELGYLLVRPPDEGGQIAATEACARTTAPTRVAPTADRPGPRRPAAVMDLSHRAGSSSISSASVRSAPPVSVWVGAQHRWVVVAWLAGYPRRQASRAFCHSSMMTARRAVACS